MMSEAQFLDVVRQGLWAASITSLPILAVALFTGLGIGLFQALTSVQEMTLTFVPKLLAISITFWICMGFMTKTLVEFFQVVILPSVWGN